MVGYKKILFSDKKNYSVCSNLSGRPNRQCLKLPTLMPVKQKIKLKAFGKMTDTTFWELRVAVAPKRDILCKLIASCLEVK